MGRSPVICLGLMSTVVLALPTAAVALAQERPTFRSHADLVVVQAVVFAKDGGPVVDLKAQDFHVFENGEERPISVFLGPESGPLEVALLVDASGSMNRWPTREATMAFLDDLHPGSCVLLLPFNDHVLSGLWAHPGDPRLRERVAKMALAGGTSLYDALEFGFRLVRAGANAGRRGDAGPPAPGLAELLRFRAPSVEPPPETFTEGSCSVRRQPWGPPVPRVEVRRAIVAVTDGEDTSSRNTIDDVLVSAWGSNVPVFAFAATRRPRSGDRNTIGEPLRIGHLKALRRLTEHTGGLVFRETYGVLSHDIFWDGFARVGAALRGHYVLGYIPTDAGSDVLVDRRDLEVKVDRRDVDVLAPDDLVRGRGASEGAALEQALRGFQALTAGRSEEALALFDTAEALGQDLGLAHYGRGLSLARMEEHERALAAFDRARQLAPWLPDLDARAAESLLALGRYDAAWERVLAAYARRSEVMPLIEQLQRVAPRQIDLDAVRPEAPRIALDVRGHGPMLGAFAVPPLLSALATDLNETDGLILIGDAASADLVLVLDVTGASQHGPRVELQAWIVLQRTDGQELFEHKYKLRDAGSPQDVQALVADVLARIRGAVPRGPSTQGSGP